MSTCIYMYQIVVVISSYSCNWRNREIACYTCAADCIYLPVDMYCAGYKLMHVVFSSCSQPWMDHCHLRKSLKKVPYSVYTMHVYTHVTCITKLLVVYYILP